MCISWSGGVLSRLACRAVAALTVVFCLSPAWVLAQYASPAEPATPAKSKIEPASRPKLEAPEKTNRDASGKTKIETRANAAAVTAEPKTAVPIAKSTSDSPLKPIPPTAPIAPAKPAVKTLALSPISENSAPSGCGCFFYRPTDKRELGPLLLHMDSQGSATLRPEGQLVAMKLIDEQHSRRNPPSISAQDRVLLKMRGSGTNASLSGIAEKNCLKNASGNTCSSVSYQSILTIDHIGKKVSQPAWGFCGCR